MLIVETALLFGLFMGGMFGYTLSSQDKPTVSYAEEQAAPIKWKPEHHKDAMYQCRVICGEGKVQSYDSLTGACKCSN
jgi:hypothetical protein